MLRTGRNHRLYRQILQFFNSVVFFTIFISCSAEDDRLCSHGVCVPKYLCDANGSLKQYGVGLIDVRLQQLECPAKTVCCKFDKANSNSVWSAETCDGKCVPASECAVGSDSLDLRLGGGGCTGDKVCCRNVPKSCDGICMPSTQCSNGLDLRLNLGDCPAQQVCCRRPSVLNDNACMGKCVFPNQCSDYNPVSGLINLRFSNGDCPTNQVCCNNVKLSDTCDGLCLPRASCDDSEIDLRVYSQQCPYNEVCCKKPKLSSQTQETTICNGICLPEDQCLTVNNTINLRTTDGCQVNEVCCVSIQSKVCSGTCTALDQCADSIALRVGELECPRSEICCTKLKSNPNSKCDGTCVSQRQCPELNTSKIMINLRSSDGKCPFKEVCCKNPVFPECDGKCVPQQQCNDVLRPFDLRSSLNVCSNNNVCCKNPKVMKDDSRSDICDGECVDPWSCSDGNSINLRLADGACPVGKTCCKKATASNQCKGSCVSREYCDDTSIDLRLGHEHLCESSKICCERPKPTFFSVRCKGVCLPFDQCADNESINLRSIGNDCPSDQICCKMPKLSSACNGTCAPANQCLDNPPNINLRLNGNSCRNNQVCCKNLKPSVSRCNGSCVPFSQCFRSLLDLRVESDICPRGEVCCQRSDYCDGSCTPIDLCETPSSSNGVNLRYGKSLCPVGQICCKKLKLCDGLCVSTDSCHAVNLTLARGECPEKQQCCKILENPKTCQGTCTSPRNCNDMPPLFPSLNLRIFEGSCPRNEICCRNPNLNMCYGKCVPSDECPANTIDLRVSNHGCSSGQICCQSERSFMLPSLTLDIPNYSTVPVSSASRPSTLSATSKCAFSSDPLAEYVIKADIPWLVTIWSRQEFLGTQRRQYECVGTLLKSDLVLTSANCLEGLSKDTLYTRIGDFNLKPLETLSKRREFNITEIVHHPDYNSRTLNANLAVLRLDRNSTLNSNVCVPESSNLDPADICFLVGWNKADLSNESVPNALPDKHNVTLTNSVKCDEGFVCSGENKTRSKCADVFEGSPVICFQGTSSMWVQVGLVAAKNRSCNDQNIPNSFVSIAANQMWIKEQINPSFQQTYQAADPTRKYLPPMA